MNPALSSQKKKSHLGTFTTAALVVTLFLFFIDEGNYSFSGLTDWGNLLALAFYFLAMIIGQSVLHMLLRPRLPESQALRLSLFFGTFTGAVAMAIIFYLWMY